MILFGYFFKIWFKCPCSVEICLEYCFARICLLRLDNLLRNELSVVVNCSELTIVVNITWFIIMFDASSTHIFYYFACETDSSSLRIHPLHFERAIKAYSPLLSRAIKIDAQVQKLGKFKISRKLKSFGQKPIFILFIMCCILVLNLANFAY